ncbi:unnamed protein product [Phaeothamnion confervicola]
MTARLPFAAPTARIMVLLPCMIVATVSSVGGGRGEWRHPRQFRATECLEPLFSVVGRGIEIPRRRFDVVAGCGRAENVLGHSTRKNLPPSPRLSLSPSPFSVCRYQLDPAASWDNGKPPFFLSSGKINTAHADAVFLWDPTILRTLINQCLSNDVSECDPADVGLPPKSDLSDRKDAAASYAPIPAMYQPGPVMPPA